MSRQNDSGPLGQGGQRSSNQSVRLKSTTPKRRQGGSTPHVIAAAVLVIANSGRCRWLVTFKCPRCGCAHASHWRGELPELMHRPTACGFGLVALHPFERSARAAA